MGLANVRALDVANMKVKVDSEIVVNWAKGEYVAKSERLQLYLQRVWEEHNQFWSFTIERIPSKGQLEARPASSATSGMDDTKLPWETITKVVEVLAMENMISEVVDAIPKWGS